MSKVHLASTYGKFLDRFEQRVNTPFATQSQRKDIPLSRSFPGLMPLLDSLDSGAIHDSRSSFPVKEWNPISQRVYYSNRFLNEKKSWTNVFDSTVSHIGRFVEMSHEASHILALEPFFCGYGQKMSQQEFIDFYYLSEGYCFWYADIIVTRKLRTKLPNGEFVLNRSAVSQGQFHPYRAFEVLKIKDPIKILEVYLDAFYGERTALYDHQNKPFVKDLFARFGHFYVNSIKNIKALKKEFDAMGIFTEFKKRFWDIEGLPCLLDESVIDFSDPRYYFYLLYAKGMKGLEKTSTKLLRRVRIRRAIQTRAYHVWTLRHALKTCRFISLSGKIIDPRLLTSKIDDYLDQLDKALHSLAQQSQKKSVDTCKAADLFYEKNILKPLKQKNIWVSQRQMIMPFTKKPFGLIGQDHDLRPAEMVDKTNFILNLMGLRTVTSKGKHKTKSNQLTQLCAKLLDISSHPDLTSDPKKAKLWRIAMNDLLTHEDCMKLWSVPLYGIDPSSSQFREITFLYE